jgi:DNA repair protein RadA/Sms
MSKIKTAFFCQNCGYESTKWVGRCPSCGQWNTFVEELVQKEKATGKTDWNAFNNEGSTGKKTMQLADVVAQEHPRIVTADTELNRVLGGGIVPGSIVLIAGEPGIGKSTLFLQIGLQLKNITTLYISGEESEQQIKMRADRLKAANKNFYLLTETSTQTIFSEIKKLKPQLLIVDLYKRCNLRLLIIAGQCVADPRMCGRVSAVCQRNRRARFLMAISQKKAPLLAQKIWSTW